MIKKILAIIGIIGLSALSSVAVYRYAPLSWLQSAPKQNFGSTITTINGSDTLSSSRSVINTNFSNLNTGKAEVTATTLSSLSSIGTITTGVWNGTPITVPFGGTGSTTLSSNQVLLGNGTSGISVPAGYGTNGQFLTSTGAGTAPNWTTSAINQASNYTWSGLHIFNTGGIIDNASSTYVGTINLNGGTNFKGISYVFPSIQGSVGQSFVNNGSGTLTWGVANNNQYTLASTSAMVVPANANANSATLNIPVGILTASSTITIDAEIDCVAGGSNTGACTTSLRDSVGDVFLNMGTSIGLSNSCTAIFHAVITANNSLSSQISTAYNPAIGCTAGSVTSFSGTSSVNLATVTGFLINLAQQAGTGNTATLKNMLITVRP